MPRWTISADRLPFMALRDSLTAGYGLIELKRDVLAGFTVGIIAIPLAMALAIAVGVAPQHGLYTAIVAGFVTALTGGSRFNVTGPTAAFVVILLPITHHYGLGGLLLASMMSGLILVTLGLTGMGRLVRFIPYPVIIGFTAGIAVVIAGLQLKDLLGLRLAADSEHFLEQMLLIVEALDSISWTDLSIGLLTFIVLLAWPRLKTAVPAPLIALLLAGLGAWLASRYLPGFEVQTIASQFSYETDGKQQAGIPPFAPTFQWPWHLPGADGQPLNVDLNLLRSLIGPAMAIAMLGAIESLLCGVIADGLTETRHRPNTELVGQGLGNLIAPLFGGITATAAIARTATNVRYGARSPVAAMVHAGVVLLAVVLLSDLLSMLPMAAMAALLLIVAWNMSEAGHFLRIVRTAPGGDVTVLLICFGLTVVFDMVLAVAVGVALAGALFIQRMSELTSAQRTRAAPSGTALELPDKVATFSIRGPLFFGAAERALHTLHRIGPEISIVMLDMADVPSMDMSAIVVFQSMVSELRQQGTALILINANPRILSKLRRAGIRREPGQLAFCRNADHGTRLARRWLDQSAHAQADARQ